MTTRAQTVDTIIDAGWVIPVAPDENVSLTDTSVVIQKGQIHDILPTKSVKGRYITDLRLDRRSCVVMPGFINAHTHAGMTILRGRADDLPLLKWLREAVWPIEAEFASRPEFCHDGTLLACAEMVKGGVTCFADKYFFPAAGAAAVLSTGMRAVLGLPIVAFPTGYANQPDEYLKRGHEVWQTFRDESLLTFAYAPHAPYTVDTADWLRIRDASHANNLPIHTHLHETADECNASEALDRSNPACHRSDAACRPFKDLDNHGVIGPNFIAAHMVHVTDEEIEICARRGMHVVNCPTSNAKLASGFCPVHKLVAAGINVALGTDSACSNNSLDLRSEMKLTALNAKNLARDATVIPAATAIKMATINGARAFGLDKTTGSLEVGKAADIISIDVATHSGNTPIFNPHSAVVYASERSDVRDVLVAGKFLFKDKDYCTIDLKKVLQRAKYWQDQMMEKFPIKKHW